MNKTNISYLSHTWNPLSMRCTPISAGCAHCWHLAMAKRLAKNSVIDRNRQTAYAGGPFLLDEKELSAPLRLKKPARIAIQLMGDSFHDAISSEWIDAILAVVSRCPQHTFMMLTKRPERMQQYFQDQNTPFRIQREIDRLLVSEECRGLKEEWKDVAGYEGLYQIQWPLPNLFIGVSVEDQPTADERIPILRSIPTANRWLSVEPLLEQTDLGLSPGLETSADYAHRGIHFVICGGETGHGARPLNPDWVRSIRNQCQAAGVAFFFKSYGEWRQVEEGTHLIHPDGRFVTRESTLLHVYGKRKDDLIDRGHPGWIRIKKVGHKAAGCLLDNQEWKEMPQ